MSEEHFDAAIGRAHRIQDEAQKVVSALRLEAMHLGDRLQTLGILLQREPESVVFDGVSFDGVVNGKFNVLESDIVDKVRLRALTDALRENLAKLSRMREFV